MKGSGEYLLSNDKTNGYYIKGCQGIKINFEGLDDTQKFREQYWKQILADRDDTSTKHRTSLTYSLSAPDAYYVLDGSYTIRCGDREYQRPILEILFLSQKTFLTTINQDLKVIEFW